MKTRNVDMNEPTLFGDTYDGPLKRFEDIHNYLYANDGLSEQQVLDEFVKVLFAKLHDERMGNHNFYLDKSDYRNNEKFLQRTHRLFEETKKKYHSYFDVSDVIQISNDSLCFVVSKLQDINFRESNQDANGVAFQKFLSRHAKGNRGQFFTPDPVIDFCVKLIQPRPDEKIIDPACGTAGFLFSALNYIKLNYPNCNIPTYIEECIFGLEINKKVSQIAKIKFLIEANAEPNIFCTNSLNKLSDIKHIVHQDLSNHFDIVLTNPPFGTQGKVMSSEMLSHFDLGYKWHRYKDNYLKSSKLMNGQVPDILFVEQCLNLLKPGGRLGIVLPNGHFENSSTSYLREFIKSRAKIIGVVLLPPETFIPFGTGVKTSLLFLEKKVEISRKQGRVFFSAIHKLGYSGNKNGTPVYKKDSKGNEIIQNGVRVIDEDFTDTIVDYERFLASKKIKSNKSFTIKFNHLGDRFDYTYYLPKNKNLINVLNNVNAVRLNEIAYIEHKKSHLLKKSCYVDYVELSDIHTKTYEIINSTRMLVSDLPSRASYELKTGDIITAVAGNSIGSRKHATAYVSKEFNNSICTNGFRILRDTSINPYYLLYYFHSELFLNQILMHRTGAAIPAISDVDFSNILVYLPSHSELEDIIEKMMKSFELRDTANKTLAGITAEININRLVKLCR